LGDYANAQTLVEDSLQRYLELNSQWDLALTLGNAAAVAVAQDRLEDATLLAAASATHRQRIGITLPITYEARFKQIEQNALKGLPDGQRLVLWTRGQSMTMVEAVNYALGNQKTSS